MLMAAVEYRSPVAPGFLFWLRRVPCQFCDQLLDALVRRLKVAIAGKGESYRFIAFVFGYTRGILAYTQSILVLGGRYGH